jgi:hypothetical protein
VVLCGGDILNKYNEPPEVLVAFNRLLDKLDRNVVTTLGQHDVPNHRISEWKKVSYYTLSPRISVLVNGETFAVKPDIRVIGCGFNDPHTVDLLNGGTIVPNPTAYDIYLIHATVGDGSNKYIRSIHDCKLVNPGLYLFGDVHNGFPVTEFSSGAIAVNPGSVTRQTYDLLDIPICSSAIYDEGNRLNIEVSPTICLSTDLRNVQVTKPKPNKMSVDDVVKLIARDALQFDKAQETVYDMVNRKGKELNISEKGISVVLNEVKDYGE